MIKKWKVTIPELTGPEPRFAYAYVPDAYKKNPDARYPVLYMFDGHNVFFDEDATYGKCWGMKEYLDKTGLPLIVVAVECNHSPDNGRLKEYSPFTFTHPELAARSFQRQDFGVQLLPGRPVTADDITAEFQ